MADTDHVIKLGWHLCPPPHQKEFQRAATYYIVKGIRHGGIFCLGALLFIIVGIVWSEVGAGISLLA